MSSLTFIILLYSFRRRCQEKRSPGTVSSAMNDHTTRRMYTKRAPGDINIYAMNEDLTTQKLSWSERNQDRIKANAQAYYLKNKDKFKQTYDINREERILKMREHHALNKERHLQQMQEWRQNNKQHLKEYYEKNKESVQLYDKKYFAENRERINERLRKKYNENAQYKINVILRTRFYKCLKERKTTKSKRMVELVGCDISEVKTHIELQWQPGMTWENHGNRGWHIDHIKPINTFDLTDIEQQKICFHYTNLRPLWATDNLSRPDDGSDII